jgi:hypothetical protein
MSDFCPEGYVPTPKAVARAAERWFYDDFDHLQSAVGSELGAKFDGDIDVAVRAAFSQSPIPDAWRDAFQKIASQTVQRLRNFLHQGKLEAFYFDNDGRHAVPRTFWATVDADGVLESGIYWPFGKPARVFEQRPNYALFLLEFGLEKLLSEQPGKKRAFPGARMPELVAALCRFDNLSNRPAQFQAVKDQPEFREFKITHAVLREAARQLPPRQAGRRPRQES